MKSIAIITARGGSKRIPGKNIKPFLGKPIIQYSIDAALSSGLFDEVMVSTDDNEIAEVAVSLGASVPFMRSKATSGDFATTAEVLSEVLGTYREQNKIFDYACCCYPTAPFISAGKLIKASAMLRNKDADCVLPVARYSVPIWWAMKKEDDLLSFYWPENQLKRSQDLQPGFYDCGQFYFFNVHRFLKSQSLFTVNTVGLEVAETEVQDIDTEDDWKLAEIKYSFLYR